MSAKSEEQARELIKKRIMPALYDAIHQLSEAIYAETRRQHPNTHAPEIYTGAQDAATRILLTELLRQIQRDPNAVAAIQRLDDLK